MDTNKRVSVLPFVNLTRYSEVLQNVFKAEFYFENYG